MSAPRHRWVALLVAIATPDLAGATQPQAERGPAYLVYAGPYSSSPSSAFGHLFLVLADDARDPPPLWNVYTFNAITSGVDALRYLTIGIAGGFLGRFDRFAFHQKTREYELLEDRDLWLLELRLADRQRTALEEALRRADGRWYPYSFFQRNCAHYLQAVLAEATGAIRQPSGVVSPAEVFEDVQASTLAGATYHRPSASRRVAALAAAASPAVLARLQSSEWMAIASDVDWLSALSPPDRLLAHEVFALRSLRTSSALPAPTREGLAKLRLLTAESRAGAPQVPSISGPGLSIPPPEFHGYPRLRVLYSAPQSASARVHVGFRAAMHDETEPRIGQQPASTMEILALELSSPVSRPEARLERAVLFSQRSLSASDWTSARRSWLLEAVARRGGLFAESVTHLEARAGLGKTVALPGRSYVHALTTLAAVGAFGEGAAIAPGLEVGFVSLVGVRCRLGGTWAREHDALAWSRSAQRLRLWTRLDGGTRSGVVLEAGLDRGSRFVRFGVDWYL